LRQGLKIGAAAELRREGSKIEASGQKLRPQAEIKPAGRFEARRAENRGGRPILWQKSIRQGA